MFTDVNRLPTTWNGHHALPITVRSVSPSLVGFSFFWTLQFHRAKDTWGNEVKEVKSASDARTAVLVCVSELQIARSGTVAKCSLALRYNAITRLSPSLLVKMHFFFWTDFISLLDLVHSFCVLLSATRSAYPLHVHESRFEGRKIAKLAKVEMAQ